jgi:hypothetical protein
LASENDFVIKAYKFDAIKEDLRKPRITRIGAVQTTLAAPTTDPVGVQRQKIFDKVGKIIDAAAAEGVNVLCLQELWCEFNRFNFLKNLHFHDSQIDKSLFKKFITKSNNCITLRIITIFIF